LDFADNSVEIFRLDEKKNGNTDNNIAVMLGEISELADKQIIYEKPVIPPVNAMAAEQQSFIDCINNNTIPFCTLEEGVAALEVAEEIYNIIKQV
jgi:predicted dehydrogenase